MYYNWNPAGKQREELIHFASPSSVMTDLAAPIGHPVVDAPLLERRHAGERTAKAPRRCDRHDELGVLRGLLHGPRVERRRFRSFIRAQLQATALVLIVQTAQDRATLRV